MRNVTLKGDIQIQELCIFWSFQKNFTFTGRKPLMQFPIITANCSKEKFQVVKYF